MTFFSETSNKPAVSKLKISFCKQGASYQFARKKNDEKKVNQKKKEKKKNKWFPLNLLQANHVILFPIFSNLR